MQAAHMGLLGPHDIGTEFIRQPLSESRKICLAHTKIREGLRSGVSGLKQVVTRVALGSWMGLLLPAIRWVTTTRRGTWWSEKRVG